jgi:hypothetical protein
MRCVLFLALLALCRVAAAVDVYLAGGVTQYRSVSGQWFVMNAPHKTYLNPPTGGVDLAGDVFGPLRWRAGYRFLGSVKSWAVAPADNCTLGLSCPFLSHWYTTGHINAVYAGPQLDWHRSDYLLYGFFGPAVMRDTEHINVPDWRVACCGPLPVTIRETRNLHVRGVAGLGIERGRFGLDFSQWYVPVIGMECQAAIPAICTGKGYMPPLHTKWVSSLTARIRVW